MKAPRLEALRSMVPVQRLELVEAALPGVQPEERLVQAVGLAQPSALPQVAAEEVPLSVRPEAASAQPWVQPEVAAEVLPWEVRVAEAELPSAEQVAAEAQRAAVPAAEEERLAAERVAEAVRPSAGQAAVPVQPSEARVELPSAGPSVHSGLQARVRPVR